jgi:hypothetical protein
MRRLILLVGLFVGALAVMSSAAQAETAHRLHASYGAMDGPTFHGLITKGPALLPGWF